MHRGDAENQIDIALVAYLTNGAIGAILLYADDERIPNELLAEDNLRMVAAPLGKAAIEEIRQNRIAPHPDGSRMYYPKLDRWQNAAVQRVIGDHVGVYDGHDEYGLPQHSFATPRRSVFFLSDDWIVQTHVSAARFAQMAPLLEIVVRATELLDVSRRSCGGEASGRSE